MKNIIRKFYKRFDRFLEHSSAGNLRLKARIIAILTGVLIIIVATLSILIALMEFEITVPAYGIINRIINKSVEFKVSVNPGHQELIKVGQKARIWIPKNGRLPILAEITRTEEVGTDFYAYLKNTSPLPIQIDESIINKEIRCRIAIGIKRLYKLLIK